MGGLAFGEARSPGASILRTPRMTPEIYHRLRDLYRKTLEHHFGSGTVEVLREAPEKTSYGDIDFVISCEDFDKANLTFAQLANEIGAAGYIRQTKDDCNLAVRQDGLRHDGAAVLYTLRSNSHKPNSELQLLPMSELEYAQVDIHLMPEDTLEWHMFGNSYGDLQGILGHMTKPLGFMLRHDGCYARLPELDRARYMPRMNVAKEAGIVFLTKDPADVMEFLGLSKARYQTGFVTLEEFYSWLGTSRLLPYAIFHKTGNKSSLKRRITTRNVFTGFWTEWLPKNRPEIFAQQRRDEGHDNQSSDQDEVEEASKELEKAQLEDSDDDERSVSPERRQEIERVRLEYLAEAGQLFDKQAEIAAQRAALSRQIDNAKAIVLLSPLFEHHSGTKEKNLNEVIRAFDRWMEVGEDGQLSIRQLYDPFARTSTPQPVPESSLYRLLSEDGEYLKNVDQLDEFVEKNWEEIRSVERKRIKACRKC